MGVERKSTVPNKGHVRNPRKKGKLGIRSSLYYFKSRDGAILFSGPAGGDLLVRDAWGWGIYDNPIKPPCRNPK